MKKRILSFILLTVMLVSLLAGCGSKETSNSDVPNTEVTENMTTSESVEDTELETEIVTEETEATEVIEETETQQEQTETTEQPTVTYTYTDMQATMYAKQSVNVRDLPSTDGEKLGALAYAQEVNVTGKCNETGWYRIDYNGSVGYVSNSYLVDEKPQEEQPKPNDPVEPSQPSGRYGGYWDYVDAGHSIYTGATLYTNTTYGTSFTVPSTSQVYRDDHPDVVNCKSPIILTMCYPSNADITLILTFAKNGNTETEALEDWRTTWGYSLWTCSDIYTTNIGGNTYYCMEATSPNGSSNELMLARQTSGKVIVYRLTSNSTKVTTDTARNYILY